MQVPACFINFLKKVINNLYQFLSCCWLQPLLSLKSNQKSKGLKSGILAGQGVSRNLLMTLSLNLEVSHYLTDPVVWGLLYLGGRKDSSCSSRLDLMPDYIGQQSISKFPVMFLLSWKQKVYILPYVHHPCPTHPSVLAESQNVDHLKHRHVHSAYLNKGSRQSTSHH